MITVAMCAALSAIAADPAAPKKPLKDWAAFAEARSGECVAGAGELALPIAIKAGKREYRLEGHRLVETSADKDETLRVGVLSATKDDRAETLAAIRTMIGRFEKKNVDLIIANGDLATDEFEMEAIFPVLAEANVLVVVLIGNTESCGSFNKTAGVVGAKRPNLINGNWVRRLELDDSTILTVPGYYDRKFTHTGGASTYDANDILELSRIGNRSKAPVVLVSHGPPLAKHKNGIDVVTDGTNVGDPMLTELVTDLKIKFGIFGHILESGGRGSDLAGKSKLAQKSWHNELFVNAGTLNPDPWSMVDGTTSHGMALYLEIEEKRARYEVERLPPPAQ
jgi:Icc-related predicted phosphoesterase